MLSAGAAFDSDERRGLLCGVSALLGDEVCSVRTTALAAGQGRAGQFSERPECGSGDDDEDVSGGEATPRSEGLQTGSSSERPGEVQAFTGGDDDDVSDEAAVPATAAAAAGSKRENKLSLV